MHIELLPLVKEVGKHVFLAAANALSDRRIRKTAMTSNLYGIDFAIEDLKVNHGVGWVHPVDDDFANKPTDIKKNGAILSEHCNAPETQLMDMTHQLKALKAMGFRKVAGLVDRLHVPPGFELSVVSQQVGRGKIVDL